MWHRISLDVSFCWCNTRHRWDHLSAMRKASVDRLNLTGSDLIFLSFCSVISTPSPRNISTMEMQEELLWECLELGVSVEHRINVSPATWYPSAGKAVKRTVSPASVPGSLRGQKMRVIWHISKKSPDHSDEIGITDIRNHKINFIPWNTINEYVLVEYPLNCT